MLRRTKRLCKAAGVEDTLKALSCLYGIELLEDNLKTCHERGTLYDETGLTESQKEFIKHLDKI